jgi:hypothetical protein
MHSKWRPAPGWISRVDRRLVRSVSAFPGGTHDTFFRRLSASADHGKLWIGAAAIMALFPGRTRRAALHGLIAQAVASAVTNAGFKTLLPRTRPLPEHLPVFRFVHPQPTSSSMPSGHSASAIAFAVGAGLVRPALGAALARRRWGSPIHASTPGRTGPRMCFSVRPSVQAPPWSPAGGGPSVRPFPRWHAPQRMPRNCQEAPASASW